MEVRFIPASEIAEYSVIGTRDFLRASGADKNSARQELQRLLESENPGCNAIAWFEESFHSGVFTCSGLAVLVIPGLFKYERLEKVVLSQLHTSIVIAVELTSGRNMLFHLQRHSSKSDSVVVLYGSEGRPPIHMVASLDTLTVGATLKLTAGHVVHEGKITSLGQHSRSQ